MCYIELENTRFFVSVALRIRKQTVGVIDFIIIECGLQPSCHCLVYMTHSSVNVIMLMSSIDFCCQSTVTSLICK